MTERFLNTAASQVVLADKETRDIFCDTFKQRRREAQRVAAAEAERAASRPERLKAFWERLGYTPDRAADEREAARRRLLAMPAAEAWIFEHPEDFNAETAPTVSAMENLVRRERRRLKAARRILKELGIK